jgi:hypothetical protein
VDLDVDSAHVLILERLVEGIVIVNRRVSVCDRREGNGRRGGQQ